jgi:hypothetical protein
MGERRLLSTQSPAVPKARHPVLQRVVPRWGSGVRDLVRIPEGARLYHQPIEGGVRPMRTALRTMAPFACVRVGKLKLYKGGIR